MFDNLYLIREQDDAESFVRQQELLKSIKKDACADDIIKLAILQINSVNHDWETARDILISYLDKFDDFNYLAIGTYVADFVYPVFSGNMFYPKLVSNYERYSDKEKAIVLYLSVFMKTHPGDKINARELIELLDRAIILDSQSPSFYDLRALLSKKKTDQTIADQMRVVLESREWKAKEDSLDPKYFIDLYILHKYEYIV